MTHRRRWLAGFAAVSLVLVTTATAFGYAGEVAKHVSISGPKGTLKAGVRYQLKVTITDAAGKRIAGQPVSWKFLSGPTTTSLTVQAVTKDKLTPQTKATNSNGQANAYVVLAAVPGSRRIAAYADGVRGTIVLNLTAAGLPNTSTLQPAAPDSPAPPITGTLLAMLAIALGGAFVLRQLALNRR